MTAAPYYSDESVTFHLGDCIDVMAGMPAASVDAVVTDPPYGLGFMGKAWDDLPPGREWAEQCLRVLKPGGHLLAFGGTRTWHRLAVAVEDAGFEIRDSIAWLYGSGFPKSLDVSKAIDKAAGAERAVVSREENWGASKAAEGKQAYGDYAGGWDVTAPSTDAAKRWAGWGTALKPAFEPVVVARKPLAGTVAANVQQFGVGALNIEACRVGRGEGDRTEYGRGAELPHANTTASLGKFAKVTPYLPDEGGRWPANVTLDDNQAAELDTQTGVTRDGTAVQRNGGGQAIFGGIAAHPGSGQQRDDAGYGGQGGASRFFPTFRYEAKAPTAERPRSEDGAAHPTVKPLDLMRWLVRLVTPPGGTVLEPFLGSGTTAEACVVEGFRCVGIEREEPYMRLAVARLSKPIEPVLDFGGVA